MLLRHHHTADCFRQIALPFLFECEAENSLLVGVANQAPDNAVLLTCHEGDRVVSAAAMVAGKPLVLSRAPEAAVSALADFLATHHSDLSHIIGPRPSADLLARLLSERTGKPFHCHPQRLHQLTEVIPPIPAPGAMHAATPSDVDLLHTWAMAFNTDAKAHEPPPDRAFIENRIKNASLVLWRLPTGQPVAMANKARPSPNGISINLVYTPSPHRCHGYASNLVATLSQSLLDSGRRFVCLYTDLLNPTSNHIYASIGFEPIADIAYCTCTERANPIRRGGA